MPKCKNFIIDEDGQNISIKNFCKKYHLNYRLVSERHRTGCRDASILKKPPHSLEYGECVGAKYPLRDPLRKLIDINEKQGIGLTVKGLEKRLQATNGKITTDTIRPRYSHMKRDKKQDENLNTYIKSAMNIIPDRNSRN